MKNMLLLFIAVLVLCLFGCSSSNNESNFLNDKKVSGVNLENVSSEYTFSKVYVDYPEYNTEKELVEAASNIYVGVVTKISYEIIDMQTGKVDSSPESKSNSRMLYTIYTLSVKNSLKGENPSEIKIRRIGGTIGHHEDEQYTKMKSSGLMSEYGGIPVVDIANNVNIGSEYLFCVKRSASGFDIVLNLTQFAYQVDSVEAEGIMNLFK